MKPAPFRYIRAESVEHALGVLAECGGEARPLSGGQSLVPLLNRRLVRPAVVLDIRELAELRSTVVNGEVRIGAAVSQREVERSTELASAVPLLAQALTFVGSVATRVRGTIGGSLAFGDPAAEIPAVMTALDAEFHVRSQGAERTLRPAEFFGGAFATSLRPDELLTEVRMPAAAAGARCAFTEVARRPGGSRATVGVAVAIELADDGRCTSVRIALSGVGERPLRATLAEDALAGQALTHETIRDAARTAADDLAPPSDAEASSGARRSLAETLMRRAIAEAGGLS
jgi:carbon-monoxide dehydrogenase medium subunit